MERDWSRRVMQLLKYRNYTDPMKKEVKEKNFFPPL